jgi:hypothetical protein
MKKLIPFYDKYVKAMSRVSALEMAFDYVLRKPEYIDESDLAFNGQQHRKKIFCDLLEKFNFQAILETGTFMGNTTGYMRQRASCPIATCESSSMFQAVAMSRLKKMNGIEFVLGDSREFLRDKLSAGAFKGTAGPLFFYLDAHWHDDLPLGSEIEIIGENVGECVVMVDDFQVPGDGNYSYDDYGKGKSLDMFTFNKSFSKAGMKVYFPTLSGAQETGGKRGCVVLCKGEQILKGMEYIQSVSSYKE